ncbi:hypothetical protein B0H66DRAFT_606381 [Apodospora peruviana]|uniref:Uncharacterized protein n=1 Tax=Apodospora peruviana TaxID=516989 RepID=A0AAE0M1M3_9PEZI|nr:hypothetical protein B0H66DRAFT_606381 [Apodospora peruviana]
MFPTFVRRMAQQASKPQVVETISPYKLKTRWPPDFKQMSKQDQFRLEKRYKRRLRHISQRPKWDKAVKLTQFFTITFVVLYSVFIMEWKDENAYQPFAELRHIVWGWFGYNYEVRIPADRPVRRMSDVNNP